MDCYAMVHNFIKQQTNSLARAYLIRLEMNIHPSGRVGLSLNLNLK